MPKSALSLSVLCVFLAVGSASASFSSAQYEGTIEAKSSQNDNASFDRHFNVSVEFSPRTEMIGTATVNEGRACEGDVDDAIPNCFTLCMTRVTIDLGKARIQVRDRVTGETVSEVLPWTADFYRDEKKNGDEPCVPSSLEGKKAVSNFVDRQFDLKSVKPGKTSLLSVYVYPFVGVMNSGSQASAPSLLRMNGDIYRVAPFSFNAQASVEWSYMNAEFSDTVAGRGILKLKN